MDDRESKVQGPLPLDLVFSFAPALALKSAVLLKIPDIIASAGPHDPHSSLSLRQIAARLPTQTPHLDYLSRILRYLSTLGIFIEYQTSSDPLDFHYGLTETAKCYFLSDQNENNAFTMIPSLLMHTHEKLMAPWHHLHECVLQGEGCEGAFSKAHGKDVWTYCMDDPDLTTVINNALASFANTVMIPFLSCYEGFKCGEKLTVVDVGGGISMKRILHDWDHERCGKILENCHRALPENGRLVVMEIVVSQDEQNPTHKIEMLSNLVMFAHTNRGRERNEQQWRRLFESSGFSPPKIVGLQGNTHFSVLEATKA